MSKIKLTTVDGSYAMQYKDKSNLVIYHLKSNVITINGKNYPTKVIKDLDAFQKFIYNSNALNPT